MFRINDNQQGSLIDPFDYLGPKRKKLLDSGWAGVFQSNIIDKLPVEEIQSSFHTHMGRPTKEIRTVLGVLILQQLFRPDRSRDGPSVCL